MIIIKNLTMTFGRKEVLKNINIELENKCYVILGSNGIGKTTLLRCIAGVYKNYKGSILNANGEKIKVGYLPQKFGAYNNLSVYETLDYISLLKNEKSDNKKIREVIHLVHLDDYKDIKMSKLSGGMIRRVGIAQALLGDSDALLLDEPTANLDPKERADILAYLKTLKYNGTILISTHILEDVKKIADDVIILNSKEMKLFQAKDYNGMSEEQIICSMK